MRRAINLAVIEEGKLLLVKKNKTWIFPGGKPEPYENDLMCLNREFMQELSGTKIIVEKYYKSFIGKTPHSETDLEARVYFGKINGKFGNASAEISDRKFISDFENYNLSDITDKIVNSLKEDNYL